ncbi:MAG: hypothetical protein D6814_05835 [Calditrichaeota bacterium]|nr:MAG: hypothetical protein D6814_05835 [Calditrichota bacterium]
MTSRLSPPKRELFWLQLHARRLDTDRLRKKIYQVVFESFLPQALSWAGAAVLLLFIALILPGYYALTPAAATLLPIWAGVRKWRKHVREKLKDQLQGSFRELIRAPNYEGKLGFLHLVESDIREVLDLIATPKEPLVIFIDDLDRCAPRHVAEVVEAINLFLAGDYRNCIFVIGMEPEIVAAALEVANRDLLEKVKEFSILDEQMPLGWRFMEKIIQLPLTLPPPAEEGLAHYIDGLVGQAEHDGESEEGGQAEARDFQSKEMDDQAVDEFAEIFRQENDIRRVMQKSEELLQEESDPAKKAAAAEASKRVFAEKFDERDPIIREFVYQAATQFHANPRKIKRYINLFRFVSTLRHNYTVDFLRVKGKRPKIPPDDALTKFVTLSIHWPQSIACLTGSPNGVANGTGQARTSIEKLERKARELAQSRSKPEKLEKEWQAFIEENGLQLGEWILSSSFRQFLARGASFCDYVGCGIW